MVAFFAFLAALFQDTPAESTGALAALIIMCVAASHLAGPGTRPRLFTPIVGSATLAGAYLFVASEANAHPTDFSFLVSLGIVWLVVGVLVMFFAVLIALGLMGNKIT